MTPQQRFWDQVDKDHSSGCWVWLGGKSHGYGNFSLTIAPGRETTVQAHRFSYEDQVAPIPDGLTLDHLCRNKACVKPTHLEPVTLVENINRSNPYFKTTRCKRGHLFTVENTHVNSRGARICLLCREAYNASRRAARSGGF